MQNFPGSNHPAGKVTVLSSCCWTISNARSSRCSSNSVGEVDRTLPNDLFCAVSLGEHISWVTFLTLVGQSGRLGSPLTREGSLAHRHKALTVSEPYNRSRVPIRDVIRSEGPTLVARRFCSLPSHAVSCRWTEFQEVIRS